VLHVFEPAQLMWEIATAHYARRAVSRQAAAAGEVGLGRSPHYTAILLTHAVRPILSLKGQTMIRTLPCLQITRVDICRSSRYVRR
jgi:hypothetical protein